MTDHYFRQRTRYHFFSHYLLDCTCILGWIGYGYIFFCFDFILAVYLDFNVKLLFYLATCIAPRSDIELNIKTGKISQSSASHDPLIKKTCPSSRWEHDAYSSSPRSRSICFSSVTYPSCIVHNSFASSLMSSSSIPTSSLRFMQSSVNFA